MKTKNYTHLIGKTATYRQLFTNDRKEGVIAKITPVYSVAGAGNIATMVDGAEVDLSLCYFSEPIF